jgi:dCMP deaminase
MIVKDADRYMRLAKEISTWSKDPRKKIGAVVVGHKGQVLSQGYNGFPRKVKDIDARYNDREVKRKFVIHAEMNCIYNASLTGVSLEGSSMFIYGLPPCSECAKGIIQSGVSKVFYYFSPDEDSTRWEESFKLSRVMFDEVGVNYYRMEL